MHREHVRWYSPSLGRDMDLLRFGHAGAPVLVFPSSMGRFYEWEDFQMVEAIADKLDAGHNQLVCLDSVDAESFYNKQISPFDRIRRHQQYEAYVMTEALPYATHAGGGQAPLVAGASFGGYHAANHFFKHPGRFAGLLSLSGAYDVKPMLDGLENDDVYYSCPSDFVPHIGDPVALDAFRRSRIVLTSGEYDPCRGPNDHLAHVLMAKNVPVSYDYAPGQFAHDWPWWRAQLARHIA